MTNKQLLETYISKHINSIYRFAYTYTTNQEDAEDVVNESVLKALKSINSLRNPDQIGTWLYRIVANTALTNIKKNKKIVYLKTTILLYFGSRTPIICSKEISEKSSPSS